MSGRAAERQSGRAYKRKSDEVFVFARSASPPLRLSAAPRGQILVPSLFVFPGLVLMAILIFEIAKLSQQKVLMQFAMDASVFMEASQASDVANRLAYLNSPWPTRVFQAAGEDFEYFQWPATIPNGVCDGSQPCFLWKYLLKNGVFPGSIDVPLDQQESVGPDTEGRFKDKLWGGRFFTEGNDVTDSIAKGFIDRRTKANNTSTPEKDLGAWVIFTYEDFDRTGGLSRQDLYEPETGGGGSVTAIMQLIGEVYKQFYQLAAMVRIVYEKLNKVFFKKTFWLNTGFTPDDDTAPRFLTITDHCTSQVMSWFMIDVQTPMGRMPRIGHWEPTAIDFGGNALCNGGTGIWQLSTMEGLDDNDDVSHVFRFGKHHYEGPANHFGIDYRDLFDGHEPYVTASAEVSGGRIWPRPKPTFQVRLRP
ncbi:MAG: hypothetical protein HY747_08585 [Elusimicrobia bacterium]|nr:hypothetical protein [Elusimicrobiota bacterium]